MSRNRVTPDQRRERRNAKHLAAVEVVRGIRRLLLHTVDHPTAVNNYRVIYDGEEVGSIGIQTGLGSQTLWAWGIDCALPRQDFQTDGRGRDREDCMRQFKDAWHKFSRKPERLEEFLTTKRNAKPAAGVMRVTTTPRRGRISTRPLTAS